MGENNIPYYKDYDEYDNGEVEDKIVFDSEVMSQYLGKNLSKGFGAHNPADLPAMTFCYILNPESEDVIKVNELGVSKYGDPGFEFQEFVLNHIEPSKTLEIAVSQSVGRRAQMEDTVVVDCTSVEGTDVIGVFDGHGGKEAAYYCSDRFVPVYLEKKGDFEDRVKQTTAQLHTETAKDSNSGTTATVVFVDKETIRVAFVGDSPAFVVRNNTLKKVTKDHKATNSDEAKRIQNNGGVILSVLGTKRVNGQIMITRSIGDKELHPPLSTEPEIVSLKRSEVDWLLVMSDGITDVVTEKELGEMVKKSGGLFNLSFDTLKMAYLNDSSDNLTLIAIKVPKQQL
ncbi:protein phosphatase 1K, putative [Entamoeba invadens IP1]|uniref:Protein phosphatase 1K, putative n=1 Tax=Entamoeba invadens IP1 TaxID=370355 RepID=L7FMB9_ENTIV|nr:protein phosphatase 1K, putative [Entamoeba invadens IP1]ELP91563.1 protein phosphatase 1K, putative [Entamoeba invadens IP1]|eukprot:XP_004258334.1 protein phosphatase 1K, putative [Entamoeba invadens IP1]